MSDLLQQLEQRGVLSTLDVELARVLCRRADERDPELALAVAIASREVQAGHVCADLTRLAAEPLGEAEGGTDALHLPELSGWLERLARSRLVSTNGLGEARPLVLDPKRRLYLARYYEHEASVAERLLELARPLPESERSEADGALVNALFPPREGPPDLQREAALRARERRLSVIVGGPGTGKTSTVVKLLALLVHDALAAGRPAPRTLLVAPTGKAAQRLGEAIERARERLPVSDAIKQAIETRTATVHRALGPIEGSLTRFRHHAERPFEHDLVLLDEASMVDLALMRRFLAALPRHARLIMLGDPDQLASVEAGGVLSDVCLAASHAGSPLAHVVSRLVESYRYPSHSGIAALAQAVHAQSLEHTLAALRSGHEDVLWHEPPEPGELGRALEREARERYAGLRVNDVAQRLATLDHFRVLCAHRSGPASVEQLNPLLGRLLGQRGRQSYAGRPLLITQNDYATQLFNGDVGVLHVVQREGPRRRELAACFRAADGHTRAVSLARLPTHESAYALTVHKSQGSEFDHVAIVLPERGSRLLSRELLYTAITRAKRGVSLYASELALRTALSRRVERASGLVDRLR